MNHTEFLYAMANPVPAVSLDLYPKGGVFQSWGKNPALYSAAFGQKDDLHKFTAGHTGLDIVGPHRTPVVAAHEGRVKEIKTDRTTLGGICAWVESPETDLFSRNDGKVVTAYGHLDELIVAENQRVAKGQTIGYMGNTGFIVSGGTPYWGNAPAGRGTHLHFTLYEYQKDQNGHFQPRFRNAMQNSSDPLPYLTRNPVGLVTTLNNIAAYLKWLAGRT